MRRAGTGLGQSLLLLPADVASAAILGRARDIYDPVRDAFVAYLVFPLLGTLSIALMVKVAQGLSLSRRGALLSATLAAVGSSFLAQATIHQENSILFALDAGMLLCAIRLREHPRAALGITGGALSVWAILTRLPALADCLVWFGLAIALASLSGTSLRAALRERLGAVLAWGVGILGGLVLDRTYHYYRFGELTSTYIHVWGRAAKAADPSLPATFPFSVPFARGAFDQLLSPSFGIWQSEPLLLGFLLVLPVAWAAIGRCARAVTVSCVVLFGLQVGFYARFYNWFGGDGWGNRFLATPAQLLSLLVATWIVGGHLPRNRVARGMALAICVLACVIGVAGTVFWYELETKQIYYLGFEFSQVLLRFANIAALPDSRFTDWGLVVPGVSPRMLTPNFAPFLAARKVPGLGLPLGASWLLVLGTGVGLVLRSVRAVPRRAGENGRAGGAGLV